MMTIHLTILVRTFLLRVLFSFIVFVLSISVSFSQESYNIFQSKNYRVKTNILVIPSAQQWSLSLEFKPSENRSGVNCFEIGRNVGIERNNVDNPDYRKSLSVTYRKIFYSEPIYKRNFLFVSPYSRLKYRDVYQKGVQSMNWFDFPPKFRDFTSLSLIGGLNIGEQTNFNRFSIGLSCGLGLGYVLKSKVRNVYGAADSFHLDGDLLVQIGFIF